MAKAGRPLGSPNRRSQQLLIQLRKDHDFEIVDEILELYGSSKQVYGTLFARVIKNLNNDIPILTGFTADEVDALNASAKNMETILSKLMSYCYPKLKAISVGQGSGEQINFNINIPELDAKKIGPALPAPEETENA